MATFHHRVGTLVRLSNDCRRASRSNPSQEFNNGVVISAEPLKNNQLFEVKIEKKISSWSGSIEIGVTSCDPAQLIFPTSATNFREGTYIMSGTSILKDGHTFFEEYGRDLDHLNEGDRIGVIRKASGALHFYVNGDDQGAAVQSIPERVWVVVDMYGKCAEVAIVGDVNRDTIIHNESVNEMIQERAFEEASERLIFNEKTGTLIKLSNGRRTAERKRPLDEFNNGVVMTNRPIKDEEMFEIRIDRLVDKWSGSIEVGITAHDPSSIDFPATMTNMRSGKLGQGRCGTIMMSGCGILTNGKGTRREYGDFNLDELSEGDRIGLMRKRSGALHYYINGLDQGVAATSAPDPAWGVVDLYGMAVKVTIVDHNDLSAGASRLSPTMTSSEVLSCLLDTFQERLQLSHGEQAQSEPLEQQQHSPRAQDDSRQLLFHTRCGEHAAVINDGRSAHRPNAIDDFNYGVVLTDRPLRPNELFEVRLDKLIDKWAGSVEIGVTTHSPTELDFPSTMTNIRSGTWMMTGNGVMHNGTTVLDDYGQNLDRLKVGDRVGAMRKADGTLHFYVNGVDQGAGASQVPADVYGVIDLYGQAAEASIVQHSPRETVVNDSNVQAEAQVASNETLVATASAASNDDEPLRFHPRHGRNSIVSGDGRTASRPNARGEFNDAIVISSRPLRDNELFEVSLDKMVDRWSGSIEAGVTLIKPNDLTFPNTMTDIDHDTWMLSGAAVMRDGMTVRNGYHVDLDQLPLNTRLGMLRASGGTLHFYVNGENMGVACSSVPSQVYAVIDLYGQCAQVSITENSRVIAFDNVSSESTPETVSEESRVAPTFEAKPQQATHRFSVCCGRNVNVQEGNCVTASRWHGFDHALVFSKDPLAAGEVFEVKVDRVDSHWSGSLSIGLTALSVSESTPISLLPASAAQLTSRPTWVVSSYEAHSCGKKRSTHYASCFDRLEVGDVIGITCTRRGDLHVFVNGDDLGVAMSGLPKKLHAVVDVYGMIQQVSIASSPSDSTINKGISSAPSVNSLESLNVSSEEDDHDEDTVEGSPLEFHSNCGVNVELSSDRLSAKRIAGFDAGIVLSRKPLRKNQMFKVKLEALDKSWSAGVQVGAVFCNPEKLVLPTSAINIERKCCVAQGSAVYRDGVKVKDRLGFNLDSLQSGVTVGLQIDNEDRLHLYLNDIKQTVLVERVVGRCHALVELYGQCRQVRIVRSNLNVSRHLEEFPEKARMEEGIKEKCHAGSAPSNCEYGHLCFRFVSSLGLPEGYFNASYNRCFCDTCHKSRGETLYYRKGDPPQDFALPAGWFKFALKMPTKRETLNIFEKWHQAYHGTKVGLTRKILDCGELLPHDGEDAVILLCPRVTSSGEKKKREGESGVRQLSLSPTIKYAASEQFSPAVEFRDPKQRKIYKAKLAFQVCVKPGSYKVAQDVVGDNNLFDVKFSNSEIAWQTKEKGATRICALLVNLKAS